MTAAARHLVIFARTPRVGQGKRRLPRDVGEFAEFRFQYVMRARLLRGVERDSRWRTCLAFTPEHLRPGSGGLPILAQGSGDGGHHDGRPPQVIDFPGLRR